MNGSFVNCISDICGRELTALVGGYKYSVFSGKTVVVEGHRGIEVYCKERIKLLLGRGWLEINGSNLSIKCMDRGFCVVEGKINAVGAHDA